MSIKKWIRNGNDCTHCPACWEEVISNENGTEYDGGCHIYGDDWPEPCRLLLPKFIRAFLCRRTKYLINHQYDDMGDWWAKSEAGREVIQKAIEEVLGDCVICWKDKDSVYHEVSTKEYINRLTFETQMDYDDHIREPRKTLRQKWRNLLNETIARPVAYIKSYL